MKPEYLMKLGNTLIVIGFLFLLARIIAGSSEFDLLAIFGALLMIIGVVISMMQTVKKRNKKA
jgi:disulfide bond formation protein DsbB